MGALAENTGDIVTMPDPASKTRVDARTVLQPNGRTKRGFSGRIVAYYRRAGPNAWDDYKLVVEDGGPINVFPGVKVQLEPSGTRFRLRQKGRVVVVEWTPSPADQAAINEGKDPHTTFLKSCIGTFKNKAGMGAAAFLAKSLNR